MHKNEQEYITKTNKNFLLFQQIFPKIIQMLFAIKNIWAIFENICSIKTDQYAPLMTVNYSLIIP